MTGPLAALDPADGAHLVQLAVAAVAAHLSRRAIPDEVPGSAALCAPGASFVTLEREERLRGCVGSLDASRPLWQDVVRNALRATRDPRLPAVTSADWPALDVKVSVLSPPEPVPVAGTVELLAALRPGVDGLLITDGERRATFLPAVWRKLSGPDRFLAALLAKGGWPADGWPSGLRVYRYTACEFRDAAPRDPLAG
jgi:AmmeMemoRadiSam system protein A